MNRAEDRGKKQPSFKLTSLQDVLTPALHNALCLCRQSALSSKVQAEEKQHIEGHMSLTKESNLSSPSNAESSRQMPESNRRGLSRPAKTSNTFAAGVVDRHTANKLRQRKCAHT